jgi:hypothetical protein
LYGRGEVERVVINDGVLWADESVSKMVGSGIREVIHTRSDAIEGSSKGGGDGGRKEGEFGFCEEGGGSVMNASQIILDLIELFEDILVKFCVIRFGSMAVVKTSVWSFSVNSVGGNCWL